jgi:hypothetical protein
MNPIAVVAVSVSAIFPAIFRAEFRLEKARKSNFNKA